MWVLMIAFPVKVARKNFQNGIPNCPHMIPARSNSGFGTWNTRSHIQNPGNKLVNKIWMHVVKPIDIMEQITQVKWIKAS